MNNLVQSAPDTRDYIFSPTGVIKPEVDLRPLASQEGIENQLNVNSCSANAVISAVEILDGKPVNYSRLFNYYTSRESLNLLGQDAGSTIRHSVQAAYKHGLPLESTWPYQPSAVHVQPSQAAYNEAKRTTAIRYELLWEISAPGLGLNKEAKIKAALSEGYPVIFGAIISEGWRDLKGDISTHDYKYDYQRQIGGHGMLFVGYKDDYFITENSWSSAWGDNGFGAFPFENLNQVFEAWIIKTVGLDDLEILINEISESDYQQAVAVAWQDANWAKFLKYVFRVGATKNDFLTLCKTLKFTKLSALTKWIVG